MPARPYQPSGKSEPGAVPQLLIGSLVVGLLVGLLEAFVSQWINLLIVFPAAIGGAVGGFAAWQVGKSKLRAPAIAGLIGLAGGLLGQVAVHYGTYLLFRSEAASALEEQNEQLKQLAAAAGPDSELAKELENVDASQQIDQYLVEETGSGGFVGFIKLEAREGTEIKKTGSSSGTKVSGVGSYVLWAFEFLIAGIIALWMAFDRARQPFCERCKRWYDVEVVPAAGSGEKGDVKAVIKALEANDFGGAVASLGQPGEKTATTLKLSRCGGCQEHEPLLLFQLTSGLNTKKPQTVVRYRSMIRPDEAKVLLDAAQARGGGEASEGQQAAS